MIISPSAISPYKIPTFQSGGVPFVGLLDLYPSAAAAYSVRRLSGVYSGSLMEVRIDTVGQPLYDIGFDENGDLDTADLISKAAGNDAFVRTWYDQSGNGNDAQNTTTSTQPKIVSGGSVILANSIPNIQFDGVDDYLSADLGSFSTNSSVYLANFKNFTTGVFAGTYFQLTPTSPNPFGVDKRYWNWAGSLSIRNGGSLSTGDALTLFANHALFSAIFDGTTVVDVYENNSPVKNTNVSGSSSTRYLTIGNWGDPISSRATRMDISEMIIYNDDNDSRVEGIKNNENTYFSIY